LVSGQKKRAGPRKRNFTRAGSVLDKSEIGGRGAGMFPGMETRQGRYRELKRQKTCTRRSNGVRIGGGETLKSHSSASTKKGGQSGRVKNY